MGIARTAAEVLNQHVTFELECIDRMYLNLYVPMLQTEGGIAHFWRDHRGYDFASSALMEPMTKRFISAIESFANQEGVEMVVFEKGQRKEDLAKEYLSRFPGEEGVLFIGKAQEKAAVVRTTRRRNPRTGQSFAWLTKSTAMVNQYYFYCVDRDFGPFFIKFCSYFPYNGRLCINGHEYLKRQLTLRGVAFEALDNSVVACENPQLAQHIADELSAEKIDALARKWFQRLPHPFPADDRRAGYRYDISILQAEFSLTQMLDRPLMGRIFFEQVIRDNIDLGRPDQVQLIFDRRISKRTPGRFRTRVLTEGVVPSLHIDYKQSRIKQYHKEGRALRTETTINNTRDFGIGKRLENLAALRQVGMAANRRLLDVQRIGSDCSIGEDAFQQVHRPIHVEGQRAAGLRFGDPRALMLLSALVLFRLLPDGFKNRDLRQQMAALLGTTPDHISPGRMTYDLRRLRLHGLIERVVGSQRYRVTQFGFKVALFLTRSYNRLLRPGMALLVESGPPAPSAIRSAVDRLDQAIDQLLAQAA
jgi:hypothetical protein